MYVIAYEYNPSDSVNMNAMHEICSFALIAGKTK